ncbi:Hemolysin, contains CBS domains [Filimonas lacunae]|uniref:Hemolysin, contains CBS domains n=1 Tax=Filimonas lacunae TaxID=477680 RepID=A0A173MRZ7_9BACT|nr:hemolysin family protein [Filimonas lacunae]BAV10220.1 magnesium and cobalt efflux protein CorC [Filimonas lacunae]SIT18117.1 Hemolysin, contains CBS domains [Filimonas lacunae]
MFFNLVVTLLLVALNGFFVAAEFAIVKVRASQLEIRVKTGNKTAALAKHIVLHLDGYLAATQLGITLASLGLGWIGEPVVSEMIISLVSIFNKTPNLELIHHISLPVAFAIITVLHIVFGELAPKSLAIQRSEKTTLLIAYPLQFFYTIFRPFIWLLNSIATVILKAIGITNTHGSEIHSSEELRYIVEQGRESGTIEEADFDIIINAFDFSGRMVKQVQIPRIQVTAVDLNTFNEEVLEKLIEDGYSRMPVYDKSFNDVKGIIYMKDILLKLRRKEPLDLRTITRPALFIPENMHIGKLLKEFQVKHHQMAIVVNEYGDVTGIVTMEDLLEELVGEIQDEYDNETPVVQQTGDKLYKVLASASLDDINELLPRPIEKEGQIVTLGGIVIFHLRRIPRLNDTVVIDNYEVTVVQMKMNSIVSLLVKDLN